MLAGGLATCCVMTVGSERSRVNDANGRCRQVSGKPGIQRQTERIRVSSSSSPMSRCEGQKGQRGALRTVGWDSGWSVVTRNPLCASKRRARVKRVATKRIAARAAMDEDSSSLSRHTSMAGSKFDSNGSCQPPLPCASAIAVP